MKTATLLHNPTAGNGKHSKKELVSLIERNGYKCRYISTKNDTWKNFNTETDLIIAAGGDGTIRQIIEELLSKKNINKTAPIAFLPLGTANNITKSLNISGPLEEIIQSWKKAKPTKHDIGSIKGISETDFFIEAVGFGLFAELLNKLQKKKNTRAKTPAAEKRATLHTLHKYIYEYKPKACKLKIDGKDYSGKYIMVEIMNTNSFGPNLNLAPYGEMTDGFLEIVLFDEKSKNQLATYILKKFKKENEPFPVIPLKAKKISISWKDNYAHADDQLITLKASDKIKIKLKKKQLRFLI